MSVKTFVFLLLSFPSGFLSRMMLFFNNVKKGNGNKIYGVIRVSNKGSIVLGNDNVIFCSPSSNKIGANLRTQLYCKKGGIIEIGDGCEISNMVVNCCKSVKLGNRVMIGGGTIIWDSNFHSTKFEKRMSGHDNDIRTKEVIIDDGAFIGANTIIKSCRIGKRSVIGAGSVVMHDIPDGECWAGNPARFVYKIY